MFALIKDKVNYCIKGYPICLKNYLTITNIYVCTVSPAHAQTHTHMHTHTHTHKHAHACAHTQDDTKINGWASRDLRFSSRELTGKCPHWPPPIRRMASCHCRSTGSCDELSRKQKQCTYVQTILSLHYELKKQVNNGQLPLVHHKHTHTHTHTHTFPKEVLEIPSSLILRIF